MANKRYAGGKFTAKGLQSNVWNFMNALSRVEVASCFLGGCFHPVPFVLRDGGRMKRQFTGGH